MIMNWYIIARRVTLAIWWGLFIWGAIHFIGIATEDSAPGSGATTLGRIAGSVGMIGFLCWGFCKLMLAAVNKSFKR